MIGYHYRPSVKGQSGHLITADNQTRPPGQAISKQAALFRRLLKNHQVLWLGLAVVALGFAVSTLWPRAIGANIHAFNSPGTLGLLLVVLAMLTTFNLTIRWLRWHFLTRRLNLGLPTKNSLKLYLVTLPALVTPLHLGEFVRIALVAKRHPNALTIVCLVWLIERLTDILVLGLLLLIMQGQWATISAMVGLVVLLIYVLRATFKTKTVYPLTQPATLSVIAISSLFIWLLPILGLWLILGQQETLLSMTGVAEIFSMSTLLGGLTIAPLDLGIINSNLTAQLQVIGISPVVAPIAVSVFRAGTIWYVLGLGLLALIRWRSHIATMVKSSQAANHFNAIAPVYKQQIPSHIRERLLTRKIAAMRDVLEASGMPPGARGLDLGCGPGWHACEMARLGYTMTACDLAYQQIESARDHAARENLPIVPQVADARTLPYADNAFDFIYGINLIHHITDDQARRETFGEIVRVLKPGGIFFLQEINTENPLFAFYMGYIFPLLRDIDEGTEWWVKPSALPDIAGAQWAGDTTHFTFIPDFAPQRLLRTLTGLERILETSVQHWSAHYVARLVKEDGL